jgi:tetraacyldisaccharide 4'-kinase
MNEEAWNSQKTDNLLVISALANPSLMLHYIKSQFSPKQLEHIEFRDHHNFTKKEVLSFVDKFHNFAAQNKAIIVSEKDAARLRSVIVDTEFERLPVFVLPIQVVFLDEDQQYFNQKILKYVRENSADHQIHSEQDEL